MPTWERPNKVQPPYADFISAVCPEAEPQEPCGQWATTIAATSKKGHLNATMQNRGLARRTMSASSLNQAENLVKTPMTAPLFNSEPVSIPSGPRTAPELPRFVYEPAQVPIVHARSHESTGPGTIPPTPSYSEVRSWDTSLSFSSQASSHIPLKSSMPMSNLKTDDQVSTEAVHACCSCKHPQHPTRFTRWRSALKSLFHNKAVDESDLEYIETSHWTEQ